MAAVAFYCSRYSPLASFTSPNALVILVPLSKLVPDGAEEAAHDSKRMVLSYAVLQKARRADSGD